MTGLVARMVIPAPVQAVWGLIRPLLPILAVAALALTLMFHCEGVGARRQAAKDQTEITRLKTEIANMKAQTAKAKADDAAHKQRVEAAQTVATKEIESDLQLQLAQAHATAAAYAQRLRNAAHRGGGGDAAMSSPADPASPAAGAGETPELDANACAEAVVKAEAWQDWWHSIEAIPR